MTKMHGTHRFTFGTGFSFWGLVVRLRVWAMFWIVGFWCCGSLKPLWFWVQFFILAFLALSCVQDMRGFYTCYRNQIIWDTVQ